MADDTIKVDILTDSTSSTKSMIKYTAAITGAYIAVNKMVTVAKVWAKAASDAEEITGKYNAVFKKYGGRRWQGC